MMERSGFLCRITLTFGCLENMEKYNLKNRFDIIYGAFDKVRQYSIEFDGKNRI
jgi:hypothetical protein